MTQVAFDAKHKLIVEQHVTNAGSDLGLLAPTTGAAKEVLGVERIDAVADMGYYKGEDMQACEDVGIEAYIARPQRGSAVRDGLFRKEEFRYDPTSETYRCHGGQQLYALYRCVKGDHTTVQYCNRDATLLETFQRDTHINVSHQSPRYVNSDAAYDDIVGILHNKTADVIVLDLPWVEDLSENLLDLSPFFTDDELKQYDPALVEHTRIRRKLVAIPWFEDIGLLYYNHKYLPELPSKLDALVTAVTQKPQGVEVPASDSFIGFLWKAMSNEGLTCNAPECIASSVAVNQQNDLDFADDRAYGAVMDL